MPMAEILLVACLVVALAGLWLRVDGLQRKIHHLESQLALHARTTARPTAEGRSVIAPLVVTGRQEVSRPTRPMLRLLKS